MNNTPKIFDDGYDDWEFSAEGIHSSFSGTYSFPSKDHENIFFTALSKLPKPVIRSSKKIYFTSASYNDFAETFTFKSKSLKRFKAIIVFYPKIWNLSFEKFVEWLAHEIAHSYLKHELGYTHSIAKEKEADELASKWLKRKINNYVKLERKLEKMETINPQ